MDLPFIVNLKTIFMFVP